MRQFFILAQYAKLVTLIAAILDPQTTRKEMTVPTFFLSLLIATGTTLSATTLNAQQETAAAEESQAVVEKLPNPLRNPGFEESEPGSRDFAWQLGGVSEQQPKEGKRTGFIASADSPSRRMGLLQGFDAKPFRGKRIRYRAAVRVECEQQSDCQAQLWFRVDRPTKDGKPSIGAFDNMHDRPITATQWQDDEIVGDVAPDAKGIVIGMLLIGDGKAFIDDVSFEVVGDDVEPTAKVIGSPAGYRPAHRSRMVGLLSVRQPRKSAPNRRKHWSLN